MVASRRARRGEVEAGYAAAVDIYRRQLFNVPGRTIWYTMESHIAVATSPEALRGQLTNVFPLAYRTYDLKPTGQLIAEAILQSVSAFEQRDWPALEARRKQSIDPVLNEQFLPHLERFMTFLLTSLNSKPIYLIQLDFNMVDRYISTGNETGMVQDRYFNIVETARFSPLGVVETIVMLMARIIDMADSNNRHGALRQLRERQEVLDRRGGREAHRRPVSRACGRDPANLPAGHAPVHARHRGVLEPLSGRKTFP